MVLIAESDPLFSRRLAEAFFARGYRVKVVGSGLECRQHLLHFPPDLLIVSEDLSWGSGLGVLETLQEDRHPSADVPVVLLLAAAAEHLIFPARFPDLKIFSKPIDPIEIVAAAQDVRICGGTARWMD